MTDSEYIMKFLPMKPTLTLLTALLLAPLATLRFRIV